MTAGSPAVAPWKTVTVSMASHEAANMTRLAATESEDLRLLKTLAQGQPLRPFARMLERQIAGEGRPDWWTLAALGTAAGAMTTLVLFVVFVYCRFRCHKQTVGDVDRHQGGDPLG